MMKAKYQVSGGGPYRVLEQCTLRNKILAKPFKDFSRGINQKKQKTKLLLTQAIPSNIWNNNTHHCYSYKNSFSEENVMDMYKRYGPKYVCTSAITPKHAF